MTPLESALWDGILGFCLDHGAAALSFAAGLATDNGWVLIYALRVLDAYRLTCMIVGYCGA